MRLLTGATILAACSTLANAACSLSTAGHGFDMYIYDSPNCAGNPHWEEFFGAGANPACDCFNVAGSLNDKVKSFVFTASRLHSIILYRDAGCKGGSLGSSVGSWIRNDVSAVGQQMSSFEVCLY